MNILTITTLVIICLANFSFAVKIRAEKKQPDYNDAIQLTVNGGPEEYKLNLKKSDESVLHPEIKVITINDDADGISAETWVPSKSQLKAAQNVYLDTEKLASVRLDWDSSKGKHIVTSGVVNGNRVEEGRFKGNALSKNHSDYIDIGRNITRSKGIFSTEPPVAVVETLIVCDKEFFDVFKQDKNRVLEYLTIFFWDVNMRYKTLPSSKVSFRITGVVLISTTKGQPFIEQARASDGRTNFNRILHNFSHWLYGEMPSLPKFDIAVAITNAEQEWGGGLAYLSAACGVDHSSPRHWGVVVWNDAGDWGSLTVATHEIGHSLGAPHDDHPDYPGGCADRGYIMGGGNDQLRWFFSTCSDRTIGNFLKSNEGSCLLRQDEPGSPPISTDFSWPPAPSMDFQCQLYTHNSKAFVEEKDTANCMKMRCAAPVEGGYRISWYPPVDNTPCFGGGRCFRGRCRKVGKLLMSVTSMECAHTQEHRFAFRGPVELKPCPRPFSGATPLDTFVMEDSRGNGILLKTAWSSADAKENGDKCVYTGNAEGGQFWTDRCSSDANEQNPWHEWDLIEFSYGEFALKHRLTKRCAKQEGSKIATYSACDFNDRSYSWTLL